MVKKRSKRFRAAKEAATLDVLDIESALERTLESATAKFDESIEFHMSTSADTRHADQQLREITHLPHSLGGEVRVLVFAEGDAASAAKEAGADYIADEETWERIESGWTDWDVSLATEDQMPKLARHGRLLGPKGLMPNKRTETVVEPSQIPGAVTTAKQGRTEIRMDRNANLHTVIGRRSFTIEQLRENLDTVYGTVSNARPEGIKGQFIKTASVCSTMGPSFRVSLASLESN